MADGFSLAHPAAHVSAEKRHELMIAERNLLVGARTEIQNSLMRTITQLSSAAILIIPTVLLGKDIEVPRFFEAKIFYMGIVLLGLSLLLSLAQQHISAVAYAEQENIVIDYYTLAGRRDHAIEIIRISRGLRIGTLAAFSVGLMLAAIGLATQV